MDMNLEGKSVLVVGLGRTGEALCSFLADRGANVSVSEKRPASQLEDRIKFWERRGIRVESGEHRRESFLTADLIVTSPGVPQLSLFKEAEGLGIPVISEVELAYHFLKGTIVGITGSNGKSTTATLIHTMLSDGGLPSHLAGNIGTPLISFAGSSRQKDIYVTELSSFQLEHIRAFKADRAVLLNVSPDHLDWHKTIDHYIAAKYRLITGLNETGIAVLNRDDPIVRAAGRRTLARVIAFSRTGKPRPGCFLEEGWIILDSNTRQRIMPVSDIQLRGPHNQENVMASVLIGETFGLTAAQMSSTIRRFQGLEHRLEKVDTFSGVSFYNDSKATNVDSTLRAIESFDRPVIIILGGRDKDGDFSKLTDAVKKQVKLILLLGEAGEKIAAVLCGSAPMFNVDTMGDAVRSGFRKAQDGDVILLAPACTSWDMYKNFEERGRHFKNEVAALKKEIVGL